MCKEAILSGQGKQDGSLQVEFIAETEPLVSQDLAVVMVDLHVHNLIIY